MSVTIITGMTETTSSHIIKELSQVIKPLWAKTETTRPKIIKWNIFGFSHERNVHACLPVPVLWPYIISCIIRRMCKYMHKCFLKEHINISTGMFVVLCVYKGGCGRHPTSCISVSVYVHMLFTVSKRAFGARLYTHMYCIYLSIVSV